VSRSGAIIEDLVRPLVAAENDDEWRDLLRQWVGRSDVASSLALLKEESERLLTIDPRAALRLARGLVFAAELADESEHLAIGLLATGDALRVLGRCPESLDSFDAAATAFLGRDDEIGWARSRIGRLFTLGLLGRAADGLADAERARDILERREQWLRAGALALNLGYALLELGRFDDALASYDQALTFYDRALAANSALRDTVEIRKAKALAGKAIVYTGRGDSRSALALHQAARAVFAHHGDSLSVIREDQNMAKVYAGQGHYTRALRLFAEAHANLEHDGLESDAAIAALDLVECYLNVNQLDRAFELGLEAATTFDRLSLPAEAAKARFYCGLARSRQGDRPAALALLDEVAHAFAEAGLGIQLGLVALERASLYLDEGDWVAAASTARDARDLFASRHLVAPRCQTELLWARAFLADGESSSAEALARDVLATSSALDLPALAPEGHHVLAEIARSRGDVATALGEYQAGISGVEKIQVRLAAQLRPDFLGDKARIFHDAIDLCLEQGRVDLAFSYLERAKSRALVDYLTGNLDVRAPASNETTRAIVDELTLLRAEHNWLYDRLYGRDALRRAEAVTEPVQRRDDAVESLRVAIRDVEKRIARGLERLDLQRAASEQEGIASKGDVTVAPPALGPDTVLLEYFFGSSASAVFVVADGRLTALPLAVRERDIRRLLNQWQLNLDASATAFARGLPLGGHGRNARGILKSLYRSLLQPAESFLVDRGRVIIVPYGATHAVPFQALYTGERFIVEQFELSLCSSSSLLGLCVDRPRQNRRSALVVANSDGGALPAVLNEARAIASLFPGEALIDEQATLANVVRAAGRHGILHLAAHGEARLDNPTFAHLKLADGRLTPADVFDLDLNGALVTLSACETGRSVVAGGDELIGLSRGFLHAGAATVVQSMWRVDDGSTAALMEGFYRLLRDGRTKGAALRDAQRGMLDNSADHPYLWAGFQMIGDGGHL
jgi:CHAT domain-containing protein